jgi:hypothetical protein
MSTGNDGLDRWLKRWGLALFLFVLFIFAVQGVVVTYAGEYKNVYFEHFFMAVAISCFIGLFIELTLQRKLVKNVFDATIGYLLPDRLRPELRWLYEQQFIAAQSYDVTIEHIEAEHRVIFHGTYKRRIENITDKTLEYEIGGGIEEMFSVHGESEVLAWTAKLIEKSAAENKDVVKKSIKVTPVPHGVGINNNAEKEKIAPNEILEVMMAYKLHLPDHGMEYLTFKCLADRPSVTIKSPASLKVELTFSHRDQDNFPIEPPVTSHTLEKMLLPHQDIKVSWHNANDLEERMRKHGLKK